MRRISDSLKRGRWNIDPRVWTGGSNAPEARCGELKSFHSAWADDLGTRAHGMGKNVLLLIRALSAGTCSLQTCTNHLCAGPGRFPSCHLPALSFWRHWCNEVSLPLSCKTAGKLVAVCPSCLLVLWLIWKARQQTDGEVLKKTFKYLLSKWLTWGSYNAVMCSVYTLRVSPVVSAWEGCEYGHRQSKPFGLFYVSTSLSVTLFIMPIIWEGGWEVSMN